MYIRWANVRNEWYFHFLISPLLPIGILIFMKLTDALGDPIKAMYATTGNAVMVLILGPMQSLSNDLAWGRQRNDLDYYAVLPFSKLQLVLGFSAISTLSAVPVMLLILLLGKFWLNFPFTFHPMIILVFILAALSMVGLGAFYGVYARNGHHANIMNGVTTALIMFLSPVLIPEENLPRILQITAKLLPTTYAVKSFRMVLLGEVNHIFALNMGILTLYTCVLLFFAVEKIDWRVE